MIPLGVRSLEWDYPEGADLVVLADTGGNRFCVIDNASAPAGFGLDFSERV